MTLFQQETEKRILGVYQAALSEVVNQFAKATGRDSIWAAQYHFQVCDSCSRRYKDPPLTGDHISDTRTLYDLQDKIRKLEHDLEEKRIIARNWRDNYYNLLGKSYL